MREKDLHQLRQWLINNTDRILTKHSALIDTHLARLRTLSPLSTLQRGYAVLRTESGVLTSTTNVTIGDTIHAQLIDGTISATITASERTDR